MTAPKPPSPNYQVVNIFLKGREVVTDMIKNLRWVNYPELFEWTLNTIIDVFIQEW